MAGEEPSRRPGALGRLISRQAARPTGLLGRIIGRPTTDEVVEALERAGFVMDEVIERPDLDSAYRWVLVTTPD